MRSTRLRLAMLGAALAAALALPPLAARADYTGKDASGANITIGGTTCRTGVQCANVDIVIGGTAAVDRGGTITAGGTPQQFMAANTSRRGFSIQNQSSADLFFSCVATATQDFHSLRIPAGGFFESSLVHVGSGACTIVGSTTGQAFYAREF